MAYILILGANSDIGNAVAREYAKNGYGIYFADKDIDKLELISKEIESKYSVKTKAFKFDALEFYNHKNFYNELSPKPFGVVCAIDYIGDQYDSEEDFLESKKIIDTNFTGCMSILNIISNDFEARKEGFITGVSSIFGDRGGRSNYTYGSAKAGFTTYLSGLRSRLVESDVNVITVKLGPVLTNVGERGEFPVLLTAKPEEVGADIFKAQQKCRDIVYSKWPCRYVSFYLKNLPEIIYKRIGT